MTRVAIVDSGVANLASVQQAFNALAIDSFIAGDPEQLTTATHVVLPGVGAFANVERLHSRGFSEVLHTWHNHSRPLLAICLGMQMLCDESDEDTGVRGLGIVTGRCRRLPQTENVPHLGWNQVTASRDPQYVQSGMAAFANSFALFEVPAGWQAAWTTHGTPFVAALEQDRTVACQFHPELSGLYGVELIKRWLRGEAVRPAVNQALSTTRVASRIIPCLDVRDGRVVKGVRFQQLRDMGEPSVCAARYETQGADEIVVLDITASSERRKTQRDTVRDVRKEIRIPLTAGGGVRSVDDARQLLHVGADKVTVNTAAVEQPVLLEELAHAFGSQCVVLAIDARQNGSGWEVLTYGGRETSGRDAIEWMKEGVERGAGEILLTSWDRDGTRAGYDLELLTTARAAIHTPLIASGGVGNKQHLADALKAGANAVLAASIFHDRQETVRDVKQFLLRQGCTVRT